MSVNPILSLSTAPTISLSSMSVTTLYCMPENYSILIPSSKIALVTFIPTILSSEIDVALIMFKHIVRGLHVDNLWIIRFFLSIHYEI